MLACRTLYVCASEFVWGCTTAVDCGCGSFRIPEDLGSLYRLEQECKPSAFQRKTIFADIRAGRYTMPGIHGFWLEVCEAYSALALTKASDRSAALAGLTRAVQERIEGQCESGIWVVDLPRALLWESYSQDSQNSSRVLEHPTWSCMSQVANSCCQCSYSTILHVASSGIPDARLFVCQSQPKPQCRS